MMSIRAYEVIHGVVKAITEVAQPVRDTATVKVLTAEGLVFDITGIKYEADGNTIWLKAEEAE